MRKSREFLRQYAPVLRPSRHITSRMVYLHYPDGVVVALVGPVNAGKSTMLNGLAGRAAAIVSDQAGTTRDIISVRLDIDGVPVTILDTAGIRDAAGEIEAEGIRRTLDAAQHADVVVLVVDAAAGNWQSEIAQLGSHINQPDRVILNKVDQGAPADAPAGRAPGLGQSVDRDRLVSPAWSNVDKIGNGDHIASGISNINRYISASCPIISCSNVVSSSLARGGTIFIQ